MPDLAAAVHWSTRSGEASYAARIVAALQTWAYYRVRVDVLAWALDVLALGGAGETAAVRVCAASYHWMTGGYDAARAHGERAVELAEPRSPTVARALDALSDIALAVGDLDESMRCSREGYDVANAAAAGRTPPRPRSGWCSPRPTPASRRRTCSPSPTGAATRAANPTWTAFVHYAEAEVLADTDPVRALAASAEAIRVAEPVDNRLVLGIATTVDTAIRCRVGPLTADTVERTCRAVAHWSASGDAALFLTCLRNVGAAAGAARRGPGAGRAGGGDLRHRRGVRRRGGPARRRAAAGAGGARRAGRTPTPGRPAPAALPRRRARSC